MRDGQPVLTVIFGAGASFDSSTLNPIYGQMVTRVASQRPPLTNDLFMPRGAQQTRMEQWKQIGGLVERVRPACQPNMEGFEQALATLLAEATTPPGKRQRAIQLLTLRYYLRDIIADIEAAWTSEQGGSSAYVGLLDEVESWRQARSGHVELITFNYDTLLEGAMERSLPHLDLRTITMSHDSGQPYRLYKAHGSISWQRRTPITWEEGDPSEYGHPHKKLVRFVDHLGFDEPMALAYENVIRAPDPAGVIEGYIHVPAIAVPIAGKATWEMPASLLSSMRSALTETDALLVIGWAAQDVPFQGELAAAARQANGQQGIDLLMVVDIPSQAQRVASMLAGPCGFNPSDGIAAAGISLTEEGFAGTLAAGRVHDWLTF
jgi:hypothetical protein